MDQLSARIDAGASVPFALLVMEAMRADEVSSNLSVRMNGCQAAGRTRRLRKRRLDELQVPLFTGGPFLAETCVSVADSARNGAKAKAVAR